ncbi:hypothetical protein HPB48_022610 [Haemaphysalis longicornis]|uniref:THAP-type domain-containing protein n=1 Tax=Haemaphysalis longicornis TaxID=44386 RepID=A0A9J6GPB2_HAELO|nr:hypothetical protein HPB48_022610 [Haemaphysalis longicornis]
MVVHSGSSGAAELLEQTTGARVRNSHRIFAFAVVCGQFSVSEWLRFAKMAHFCAPLCKSDEKKKTPGLSFHEIPYDIDLRSKWLVAIRRDGWAPNDSSCYTKVCTRHFKHDDFIEGNMRRLKDGTVPSIFDDYSQRLQPKPVPDRSSSEEQERWNKMAHFGGKGRTDASSAITSRWIPLPCTAIINRILA